MADPKSKLTTRLLRTREAAVYLAMSMWKVRKLISDGKLPIVRDEYEGPFLIDIKDLDAYIAANKHSIIVPL